VFVPRLFPFRARPVWFGFLFALAATVAFAQPRDGGRGGFSPGGRGGFRGFGPDPEEDLPGNYVRLEGGGVINEDTVRTARETVSHSTGTPNWTNPRAFDKDVFTFVRIIFKSNRLGRGGWGGRSAGWMGWVNDYPDSDLNLSWRLQQLTSLKVDPDGRVLKLTSPDLFDYPFIYAVKPGRMELSDDEVAPLRKYLQNGGALMADDFWGTLEWGSFERQMARVLPGRGWIDLPRNHAVFHCVFNIDKDQLQVPPIHFFERTGGSSRNGEDSREYHVRAWLDDKGRIMVIATHNTDNGDGWEREGENDEYFHKFSEARAYPLAINIVFYLMTH
jgi:hypothetical protein